MVERRGSEPWGGAETALPVLGNLFLHQSWLCTLAKHRTVQYISDKVQYSTWNTIHTWPDRLSPQVPCPASVVVGTPVPGPPGGETSDKNTNSDVSKVQISPLVALKTPPFQCSRTVWRWCPPRTDTHQLQNCTGSRHWDWGWKWAGAELVPGPDVNLKSRKAVPPIGHLGGLEGWSTLGGRDRVVSETNSVNQLIKPKEWKRNLPSKNVELFTDTEVSNLEETSLVQEQVARLDVFVYNAWG